MPGFDRTGPRGLGPMTGRGLGSCAVPAGRQGGGIGYSRGYGMGYGRGFGRGFRRFYTRQEEVGDLKAYRDELRAELKALDEELKEVK